MDDRGDSTSGDCAAAIPLFPFLGIMRGREVGAGSRIDLDAASVQEGFSVRDFDVIFPNVANQYMDWIILLLWVASSLPWQLKNGICTNESPQHSSSCWRTAPSAGAGVYVGYWISIYVVVEYGDSFDDDADGYVPDFAVRRAQCRACGTGSNDRQAGRELSLTLLLGIAYSASIGGFATLIGTPPNGVLVTQLPQLFPEAPDLTFSTWMILRFL